MRLTGLLCLAILCQAYGLAFDWVAGGGLGNIICHFSSTQTCAVPTRAGNLLAAFTLLMLIPAACVFLYGWFSQKLRFARATAFLGLLLVTA